MEKEVTSLRHKFSRFLRILGPGLITGAADDDPSGIATYAQTGAQFGYGLLWTAAFMLPLMAAVQEASARIGVVTGRGIAAVVKENYGKKILYPVVLLVLIANTINIGADIGAMAAAAQLVVPAPFAFLMILFTAVILFLEIFTSYKVYAKILKWLALSLLAYPLTVFIIHQPWSTIFHATFIPHFQFDFAFLFIITGVLGTTISPYMFFWEASEEVEEEKERRMIVHEKPHITWHYIRSMRTDNLMGMIVSEIATWSIIVVGATVLNSHGITNIRTSADAAMALEPLVKTFPNAGFLSKCIFSFGIIGLGLLSVPVLSGSASYAVAEAFNWRAGLNYKLRRAHGFYGVITIATLIGLLINFIGVDPIQALVYSAVINAIVSVPLILLIVFITRSKKIMGEYVNGWVSNLILFVTALCVTLAVVALAFAFFTHAM